QQAVEARTKAEQRKRAADETAEKRTVAAKKQADEAAAQRNKAAQAAKRQQEAKIGAAEQRATKAAESKLDDAQAKRSEAASRRAQADRVEELANIEKQKRRSDRVQQLTTGGDGPWSTEKACTAARLCGRFPPAPHARLLVRSGTHRVD